MTIDIDKEFNDTLQMLSKQFGEDLDIKAVLFLIGIQELGKGYVKLNKNAKLDVMHIAICTLLTPYGFYEFEGRDKDGWPHFKAVEQLPPLKSGQQLYLMKQAIVEYFKTNDPQNIN
jgi:hypothetical protein